MQILLEEKMDKKIFLIILIGLVVFQNISALGVTPGRTSLNFESGLSKQIPFSVLNTENKAMDVIFVVKGDLAQYIVFSESGAHFNSGEQSKSFSYTLNLPASFEKPGKYQAEIFVLEVSKADLELVTSVGGSVAVISGLEIYVPYPNKYAEAEMNVIENNGKITFVIPVINRGKLDIINLKATIDILDGTGTKIMSIESNTETLNSLERKELYAEWTPGVNPGRYKAVAAVRYDDEITSVYKEFNIGEMFLEILEIIVKDFELGSIAKFNALVENKWSSDLKDVFLNILVYNNEGEIMADFKSPTYDVDALGKSELVAYWDTAGVHEGTYEGKLILKYGEKSTEKNIEMKISQYNLEVVGFTGHVLVKGAGGKLNTNVILILIVGVLVVANIVWFVLIRRILKKRK
jgi:hypothetical protein